VISESDWATIFEYVQSRLKSNTNSIALSPGGLNWLHGLDGSPAGRLLTTCLAIDLKAGSVHPDLVNSVFNSLPDRKADICTEITRRIRAEAGTSTTDWTYGSSRTSTSPEDRERFVRVLELGRFIRYYVRPTLGKNVRPDQVEEVLRQFFEDEEGGQMGDIHEWWAGDSGRVWVLPATEFLELRKQANSREPGTVFLDALGVPFPPGDGVGPDGCPHMVAIEYPDQATLASEKHCEPRQPTALDATWDGPFPMYVSYGKEDGWGRTQSCTGQRYLNNRYGTPRERVHGKFKGLTTEFRARKVGLASPQTGLQTEHVLSAAVERFNDLEQDGSVKRN
jgi:hypothetical protein